MLSSRLGSSDAIRSTERREFITLLGAAATWPVSARAQEPGRIYRLGVLHQLPRTAAQFARLFDGLRRQGFIEGRNLAVDPRGFGSSGQQYQELVAEMVQSGADVIFCGGDAAMRAAQEVTRTVPIIGIADDMVGSGLAASLSRPGGNATGFSILSAELDGKRQELLTELVPGARRMAALFDPIAKPPAQLQTLVNAARSHGVEVSTHPASRVEEIVPAVDAAHAAGAAALNVLASVVLNSHRHVIFERTIALRMPAIYQFPESAEQGGFAGYGPRLEEIYRQMAASVARLLRGERPQDLPVQQPTTFELVINLNTAKAIGRVIPETLLIRADKVIE
jgi:putative tryptophan/tyrosine transport system substrate-binding protein